MDPKVTRLSPATRRTLRVVGPLVLLTGLTLTVISFAEFLSLDLGDGMPKYGWMAFVGLPLMAVGAWITLFAFMKPLAEITATETAGAVEVGGHALGRGVGRGLKEGLGGGFAAAPVSVVKVRCRKCGYLESDDARFCSQCRAPV